MKLSISLPDELVARIDRERGDVSRSRWIARRLERVPPPGSITSEEPPTPKATRSPETKQDADLERSIDEAGEKMPRLGKPPLQRPIIQKRGK